MTDSRTRAVVAGASMAGLLAARVLSETFDRVTLVERDDLPAEPVPRRGVPQGRHPHGVLARGVQVLDELFPALLEELAAHGAVVGDMQQDVRWYVDGHLLRQQPIGMQGIGLTRPLLEDRVRARVLALPGVDVVAPADVDGFVLADGRVTGVRIRRGNRSAGPQTTDVLPADLVVDATGRGSHTPAWLESQGLPRPAEERIDVGMRYTTWVLPRRPGDLGGDRACLIGATVARPRFGAALSVEGDRWIVGAGGYRGDAAPTDLAGFRDYVATLPASELCELVSDREPVDDPHTYHFASSTRRRYEQLTRFPDGLLVTGDALSSFNPVYGQGITVAALEALALRKVLAAGADRSARRFFRRVARLIDVPWDMAAGGDLRIPSVSGPRLLRVRVMNAYVARVQAASAVDAAVGRAFLLVANLTDPPQKLLRPRFAASVLLKARHAGPVAAPVAGSGSAVGLPRPREVSPAEAVGAEHDRPLRER
ncbi:hypothetical protein [Blastococcus saxobsidens]|uniref:2-polyprenyl-6-methoxyphenol hydroxylase-like FAD-dependent oxidoreductase n=1 Tax=Blastococcus saxobsidens (strain DD2) TaxID=1146883 RepID=H6RLK8_BLASD|nr:hypothetical protein [Blastococcus saxobsidens]CCG03734.1 conserved protein of unknown function [Blastococcus saxobsidens DD2]